MVSDEMIISKRLLGVLLLLGTMFALAVTIFSEENANIVFGWLLGVLLGTMLVLTVMVFAE